MVPKSVFIALVGFALVSSSGVPLADEVRADQFPGLDLSRAVLSPKPLGPETQFAPAPTQANSASPSAADTPAPVAETKPALPTVARKVRTARVRAEKPPHLARVKLARRHTNPLDAQASDRRIQVWPCRSGGICDWQRH